MAIDQTGVSEGRYIAYWALCLVKQRGSVESSLDSVIIRWLSASTCSAEAQPLSHVFTEDSCCPGIGPLVSSQQSFLEFSNGILMLSCACSILRSIFFRLFHLLTREMSHLILTVREPIAQPLAQSPVVRRKECLTREIVPIKSRHCRRAAPGLFLGTCLIHNVNKHCHLVFQAHKQIPSSCLE